MLKNRVFWHISRIFGRKKIFSENRAPSHFGHCHFASLCQKSAKNNEPISRKAGNRRTHGRTHGQRLIYRTSEVGPKKVCFNKYRHFGLKTRTKQEFVKLAKVSSFNKTVFTISTLMYTKKTSFGSKSDII